MNSNDQKSINNLYSEAVVQSASGKINTTQLASSPEIEEIKNEIGSSMLLDVFNDLALKALKTAGINTQGLSQQKLNNIISKVLGAKIGYSKNGDDIYVSADVEYDPYQNQYTK